MARVFTITPGLENMGALKTGGQGSVYKGKRFGEIITAVKILPTPIHSESADDRNYTAFQNEVEKLKKVNRTPNPNVVKILSSGVTEIGNFPYIEMEYIEGPDLQDLLHPPHDPIFTIKETLKVAEQLSNALAHCHKLDVRHGDIKSNNVKFNSETGNYILLDFGLAIMSDEQRRSSIRPAGAIEFMAPEQNDGQMLFESDVYGFGVILFELLTGSVPFRLIDRGESARNDVRLAHMVTPVPDLLETRQAALPLHWSSKKKEQEMSVPGWLVKLVYKCLEKKPESRFENGIVLHNTIVEKYLATPGANGENKLLTAFQQAKETTTANQQELKQQLIEYQQELSRKEDEINVLKIKLQDQFQPIKPVVETVGRRPNRVSVFSFTLLLLLTIALAVFVLSPVLRKNATFRSFMAGNSDSGRAGNGSEQLDSGSSAGDNSASSNIDETPLQEKVGPRVLSHQDSIDNGLVNKQPEQQENNGNASDNTQDNTANQQTDGNVEVGQDTTPNKNESKPTEVPADENNDNKNNPTKRFLVTSKAYFYNEPDENTKRVEYISPLDKAVVDALSDRYGFIYVVITNPQGRVFKGWLRKSDLKAYTDE